MMRAEPMLSRARLPLLVGLRDLATQAADLDSHDEDEALPAQRDTLLAILGKTLELLGRLLPADAVAEVIDPLEEQLGDVCFAGKIDLGQIFRELESAAGPDALANALETGQRRLRRAVRAILEAAREAGEPDVLGGAHQGRHRLADLDSALTVRRLYRQFRGHLRRPEARTQEAVLVAVRYAAGAIAAVVASPDYGDVRASDRAILRRLRERMLDWGRGAKELQDGLDILQDVWTAADLLRDVNRRQELRAHDGALLALLAKGPAGDVAAWVAAHEPLVGLDDRLDALLDLARAGTPVVALVPDLLSRLAQLQ
jgi:hypothetical protein